MSAVTAPVVRFECELRQIKSMADGTFNVTFNLPEYCIPQAKIMMDWLNGILTIDAKFQGKEDDDPTPAPDETADGWGDSVKGWK